MASVEMEEEVQEQQAEERWRVSSSLGNLRGEIYATVAWMCGTERCVDMRTRQLLILSNALSSSIIIASNKGNNTICNENNNILFLKIKVLIVTIIVIRLILIVIIRFVRMKMVIV